MFAIEHSGVKPDLIIYAKGFANGMPISGIVTRKEIMDSMPPGSLVSMDHDLADIRAEPTRATLSPAPPHSPPPPTCVHTISSETSMSAPSRSLLDSVRSKPTLLTVDG
jgi:hypothetical protein